MLPILGFFLYAFIPVLDFATDLAYMTTNEFANVYMFGFVLSSFVLSISFFFKYLYSNGPRARLLVVQIPPEYLHPISDTPLKTVHNACVWFLYSLMSLYLIPWAVFGAFLFMTKLFSVVSIQSMWWSVWSGPPQTANQGEAVAKKGIIDWYFLNESIYTEIFFEAIPQLLLQVVNNSMLNHHWTTLAVWSTSISLLMVKLRTYYLFSSLFYMHVSP